MMDFEWKPSVGTVLRCISTFSGLKSMINNPERVDKKSRINNPERVDKKSMINNPERKSMINNPDT